MSNFKLINSGWNRLGLQPSEMLEVVADRDVWRLNLWLLPPQPSRTWAALKEEDTILSLFLRHILTYFWNILSLFRTKFLRPYKPCKLTF